MALNSYYDYVLKEIPLFGGLKKAEFAFIKKKFGIVEYKKGQVVYKEGSAPSFFYLIIRGRIAVSTQDRYGKQTILEQLHRGKYFGVISSLTGDPHSVTAKALNDCLLLTIPRDEFEHILKKIPQLAIELTKTLSRRLKHKDLHQKTVFESTIISALSSYPQAGKTIYASNLAFSLSREAHKSVVILDICPPDKVPRMPRILESRGQYKVFNLSSRLLIPSQIYEYILKDKFGVDIIYLTYTQNNTFWPRTVVEILSLLVNDYHFLILDLPCCREEAILNILNQSDAIHILTNPVSKHLRSTRKLIGSLETKFHFPRNKIKVIVNQSGPEKMPAEQQHKLLEYEMFANVPRIHSRASGRMVLDQPESEYARAVRRISRQEGDCLVGLALGVGLSYGFCHIGVLKVIEEEKIPIDVISGSSIGAVIASLWSIGKTSEEILHITREFQQPRTIWNLLDFTFPLLGIIKGDKLHHFLKRHLGNKTFYDVKIPLKIVASDVKKRETHIFEKGPLLDAIMASCAMPGVFAPFKLKEELLFDGGVLNPLPTEPLFEMGVKKIIAVNVTPSKEDVSRQIETIKDALPVNAAVRHAPGWEGLKALVKDKFKVNILDFIFSSFEVMQYEVAQKEARLADVVLHPNMSGLHWLELHKSEEFARRGEAEARRNIEKIKQLIG
ncbi:MAG TPA: patatin-like phospholipase family protein [Candidatus Omnitrophota bacterium]|nr:patatin-like phospholipase family protein [Candidatus Omnitrophota bacterium]